MSPVIPECLLPHETVGHQLPGEVLGHPRLVLVRGDQLPLPLAVIHLWIPISFM